jgi:hypothetical protein
MRPAIFLMFPLAICSLSCGVSFDVTDVREARGGYARNGVYALREEVAMVEFTELNVTPERGLFLFRASEAESYLHSKEIRVKAMIPVGTRVKFRSVRVFTYFDFNATNAYGTLLDGAQAGKVVCLNPVSIGSGRSTGLNPRSPDPAYLVEAADPGADDLARFQRE